MFPLNIAFVINWTLGHTYDFLKVQKLNKKIPNAKGLSANFKSHLAWCFMLIIT
jgi:hypothetical protein